MSYHKSNHQYVDAEAITPLASALRSSTVSSAAIEVGDNHTLRMLQDATASSGSPTLDTDCETGPTAAGPWIVVGSFAQETGVGSERKAFSGLDRFARFTATFGGTGDITYSVSGELV